MKVTGPGSGAPATGPDKLESVDKAGGAPVGRTFAETLASSSPGATGAQAADPANPANSMTADIAADLKAGKVDARGALDRVVERVLDRQLGPDASTALRAQLRDALRDTISGDPSLAARLRGLE